MNDSNSTFRQKVREDIQSGRLPKRRPQRTWGGLGSGASCMVCGEPVKQDEVEFELEFTRADDDSRVDVQHAHSRCIAAWESERLAFEPAPEAIQAGDAPHLAAHSSSVFAGPPQVNSGATLNGHALPGAGNGATIGTDELDSTYKREPSR